MTYQEALHYLNSFIDYEKKDNYNYANSFKLDRIKELCALLGNPEKSVRAIHVAGSKGKGSTAAMIQSILSNAGYDAGLYTSPHLVSFCERIKIGDEVISEDDVGTIMETIKAAVAKMTPEKPTFFEVYTALAYLYFKIKDVDIAVYEVGLGGRLDATNIIEPLVSVITPISFEHTAILGDTIAEIAIEKAGIIKQDGVCVSAPQPPEALEVIERICEERNAQLVLVGRDITGEEIEATDQEEVFNVSGFFNEYHKIHMKLLGEHQVTNATAAIGAIEALRLGGICIDQASVKRGLGAVRWPGRLEVVRKRSPRIVLDGAQNKASADALARSIQKVFKYKRLILVLGISSDKDIKGILQELVPIADSIILTRSKITERAMDPARIDAMITPRSKEVMVTESVKAALDHAIGIAGVSDLILVTGSLFVVGEARHILIRDGLHE